MLKFKIFRNKVLPSVLDALYSELDKMCQEARSICIIPDGWTPPYIKTEFIGIAAILISESYQRQLVILGMHEMPDGHSAEETKKSIEFIMNKYKFDKLKIFGKIC